MCDTKFWKVNENLWSVYKKPCFEILSAVSSIFDLSVIKKVHSPFLELKTFFSLNEASKNPSFRTDFKNVQMTLVKSAPKKSFSQKIILPGVSRRWCDLFYRLLHSYTRHIERVARGGRDTFSKCTGLRPCWRSPMRLRVPGHAGRVTLSRHPPPPNSTFTQAKISDF